jgi:dihydropteroate synthase
MIELQKNTIKIMGILNSTPDSFFMESRLIDNNSIDLQKYNHADIIDVGFESSRPGANPLSENDEMIRLDNFLTHGPNFKQTLSIDSYKPQVAQIALENGFNMINDIKGGGKDGKMLEIAAIFKCPIVLMHMLGNPVTMQIKPYYDNIMDELKHFFETKIEFAKSFGIEESQIIIDPGIGFGKRIIHNDTIINNLSELKQFGVPLLIGISRKSFISIDDDGVEDRLPATLGATALAVKNGADIIRVHDVVENYRMLSVVSRIIQRKNIKEQMVTNEI